MKKIIAAVVLIIVILASIPFVSGYMMERTVRRTFHDLNSLYSDMGTGYSLEIINYNRRYLTSDIQWKIDFGPLKAVYQIEEVILNDHARHGFAGVVSTTSFEKNPWFDTFVGEKLQGRNPVHISSQYDLLGNIETTVALDAFTFSVENEKIDVKPFNLVIATDDKLKKFNSSGSWQGLSAGEKFSIGKMSIASNLERFSTFVWDGDFNFGLQHIKARENEVQFELKELKGAYLLAMNTDQTLLSGEAIFSIESLDAKDTKVDNASVRFAAKGIDVKGYEEFMKMYSQIMSKFAGNMALAREDSEKAKQIMNQQMATIGFQMAAAYEKLLKGGLEFRISDLQVKLPDGDIKGDITLRLLKDMSFMQFAPIVSQPELLLDIFYLKSDISLPVKLVGENPNLLAPAYPGMQTGLFVKKGDNLVHKAETINGKLMINSKEVVLAR